MVIYKCVCCGGNINRVTMICEYCGTRYKEEYGNLLRIEMFKNPVQTLKSKMVLEGKYFKANPQMYTEYAIKQLSRQFAECIAPYMDVHYEYNPCECTAELSAQIKIIEPINKPTYEL